MRIGFLCLLSAAAAAMPVPASAAQCAMSREERGWIESSLQAWTYMAKERLHLPAAEPPLIAVFDATCQFEAKAGNKPNWRGHLHRGKIRLPDGNEVPVQVTSFAGRDDQRSVTFFVMALPSIWAAANLPISGDLKGLTGVFLHEFSHTRQIAPLKAVFDTAEATHKMGDDFSDDSLQERFKSDPAYVAVIEKEVDLLYQAAAEPDATRAKALVRQALTLMEARQGRWFVGEDSYWKHYDDLFLTMEGFGQWNGYAWLSDPRGGALTAAEAQQRMRGRRRWWSQEEGLALFLLIDRFVPDWPQRAFASNPALAIDLLRLAVAQ